MPTEQELEALSPTELAVRCGKIAENANHYGDDVVKKALKLKYEWAALQTPPERLLKAEQEKKAKLQEWRKRAAEFLASIPAIYTSRPTTGTAEGACLSVHRGIIIGQIRINRRLIRFASPFTFAL